MAEKLKHGLKTKKELDSYTRNSFSSSNLDLMEKVWIRTQVNFVSNLLVCFKVASNGII